MTNPKTKLIMSGVFLAIGLIYTISPIDFVPEAILGPLGYVDDLGILGMSFIASLVSFLKYRKQISDVERR